MNLWDGFDAFKATHITCILQYISWMKYQVLLKIPEKETSADWVSLTDDDDEWQTIKVNNIWCQCNINRDIHRDICFLKSLTIHRRSLRQFPGYRKCIWRDCHRNTYSKPEHLIFQIKFRHLTDTYEMILRQIYQTHILWKNRYVTRH